MEHLVSENTVRHFTDEVANQHHAMAGAVIAASAAQAVALGTACVQITLADREKSQNPGEIAALLEQLTGIKDSLIDWCNRDATAIAEFVALREAGDELSGQQLLCNAPAEISHLSITAANILQNFRTAVSERVRDDLEMSITLLAATAQAAMLLLDSNLRIWPEKALLDRYESIRAELEQRVRQLRPAARIRA